MSEFGRLVEELEQTATRLRDAGVSHDEAAELVERAAELAGRLGAEVDREARRPVAGEPPDQESLL